MRLSKRVDKLEQKLGITTLTEIKPGGGRLLTGKSSDEIINLVEAAISPADQDVVEQIEVFMEQAERTPRIRRSDGEPERYENGEIIYESHYYMNWLLGLHVGSWSLPKKMPRVALEAFNSRYGCVLWRCENCLMALANGKRWDSCPICASRNISQKKLWGPPWDAHWEYTPVPGIHAERLKGTK